MAAGGGRPLVRLSVPNLVREPKVPRKALLSQGHRDQHRQRLPLAKPVEGGGGAGQREERVSQSGEEVEPVRGRSEEQGQPDPHCSAFSLQRFYFWSPNPFL